MIGNNVIIMNQETVTLAVQEYLDRTMIKGIIVKEMTPTYVDSKQCYTIKIESPITEEVV